MHEPYCVHGDLHIGNIISDGERDLWIDVGEFAYGTPEWDLSIMWRMTHNLNVERANRLFHVTPEALAAHWNIFFPSYLGTSDSQAIGEAIKRLFHMQPSNFRTYSIWHSMPHCPMSRFKTMLSF